MSLQHTGSQRTVLQYGNIMGIQQQHLTVPVPWPDLLGSSSTMKSRSRPYTPNEGVQRETPTACFSEPKKKKGSVRDFQFKYKTEVFIYIYIYIALQILDRQ